MSVPLVEITRGPLRESLHRGDIAVVDHKGKLLARAGDPEVVTYFRSAAKPIQALEVILSGAADRYGLDDRELAVICSSHYGQDFHRQTVQSILDKIGLDTSALRLAALHKNRICLGGRPPGSGPRTAFQRLFGKACRDVGRLPTPGL